MRPALVAPPTPTLAELIAEHPAATGAEIVAELRRQSAANLAEADALERSGQPGRAS